WKPPDLSVDANYIPVEAPKFYLWALITNYVACVAEGDITNYELCSPLSIISERGKAQLIRHSTEIRYSLITQTKPV
ncbi:MAG: hypothetical protein AAF757_19235, partial [Cyanobacteria bacterium P01_D01_bin.116]